MAATVAFEVAPFVVLGPFAGIVADRFSRRRVMIVADVSRAALVTVLAVFHESVPLVYAVAFGLSIGSLAFNPASSSLVPDVVDADELVDANAGLWTVAVVAQIVLAPLAGVIIGFAGVGVAFAVNAVSYVGSALWLRTLDAGRRPASGDIRGWTAVVEGVSAVWSNAVLARLAVVQVLASLSAGATSGLLIVLSSEWLGVGPSGFGLLLGAIALGAAAGPLLLRRFIRPGDRFWLFGPYALRGGVDLTLAAVGQPLIAGGALALYGVGTSTGMVAYQSTVQSLVPPDLRGRAFSLFDVLWNATRLISLGLGGILADVVSIRVVYVLGGLLLVLAGTIGLTVPSDTKPARASASPGET